MAVLWPSSLFLIYFNRDKKTKYQVVKVSPGGSSCSLSRSLSRPLSCSLSHPMSCSLSHPLSHSLGLVSPPQYYNLRSPPPCRAGVRGQDREWDRGWDREWDREWDRGWDREWDRERDRGQDREQNRGHDKGGETGSKTGGEAGLMPLTNLNPTWWWGP